MLSTSKLRVYPVLRSIIKCWFLGFLGVSIFFMGTISWASDRQVEVSLASLAKSPQWLALGHYKTNSKSSYIDSEKFFLNSDLHISELKEIDLYEVFPVLKGNLMSVAGEWNGFDEKWLKESCEKTYLKRKNSFFIKIS